MHRLNTKPNWQQKRKIKNDRKLARKRAKETGRTRYWREYSRKRKADRILSELRSNSNG